MQKSMAFLYVNKHHTEYIFEEEISTHHKLEQKNT